MTAPAQRIGFERLLWAAGIVVGASLPHWQQLPVWAPALLCAAVAWRLATSQLGWARPARALRLLLAVAAFCAVLAQYRTINGVDAGSALLVVMVALKFLETETQRDQLVLIIICYFLMFASVLTERSLLTAVYLLALVWITTVGLLQLGREGPLLPSRVTARQSAKLLLHSLPIMVLLFLLFPRLPGPLWAIPGSTSSGASGLSDTMSPGDITNLGLSDEIAFRVQFSSPAPRASALYWRGPVLTHFNGRTWSQRQGMGRDVAKTLQFSGAPTEYRMMLEPTDRNWAFALDMPQSWSGERSLRMGRDYQLGTFFGAEPRRRRLDYRVTSYPEYRALEPLTPEEQRLFRHVPADSSPRARALVAEWVTADPEPLAVIERALDYLRTQPFFYTLTPPALGSQPVDEFLFETREGFCEHYASAFAVMLRLAGIATRVVTGYQGGELNRVGDYYIVRQSEAHAWTEVWLEDRGWLRLDPIAAVAPERLSLGSSGVSFGREAQGRLEITRLSWVRSALLAWDAANIYWRDWIVGYGPELQRALLERIGLGDLRWGDRLGLLLALAVGTTVAALLALTAYLAWRSRARQRPDPAAREFRRFCRRLARSRIAPPALGEPPSAFAQRAAAALPQAGAAIEEIVEAYLAARYEPDTDRTALARLRRRVGEFRPA